MALSAGQPAPSWSRIKAALIVAMDRSDVASWIDLYEAAWRSPGTELLGDLFTSDVSYLPSPWAEAVKGLEALRTFWEQERKGPDEAFTMRYELVAVEGGTAVARITVEYGREGSWRDLWVLRFVGDGRCSWFEEWPFAPGQDDGHWHDPSTSGFR